MERVDGFAPLSDYGMLADGRGAALVAADGAVDWFAAPRLDSAPLCAALVDPERGGALTLHPAVEHTSSQRYLPETMTLETTFRCADAVVRVTDSLNRAGTGQLPWTELARRVEVTGDPVPMVWSVHPGHRLGSERPWGEVRQGQALLHVGPLLVGLVTDGAGQPHLEQTPGGAAVTGEFTARAEGHALLAVTVSEAEPLPCPAAADVDRRIDATTEEWTRWCGRVDYDGPHREMVTRSALALKALTVAPTAAIAAALTTSLPERIGGPRNFDYRFGWVRDSSFAIDAQAQLGLTEEVHGSLSWLLRAVRRTAPEVRAMYTLEGEPASAEMSSLEHLPGYRGSVPVQVGNSAAQQLQLGAYGDLLDAVWRYVDNGGQLDPGSGEVLASIVDEVCDRWQCRDAGLWELGDQQHYTISKIGCWVALDRGVRLAEGGQVPAMRADRWRTERDTVHAWVDEHCWSPTKDSYTFHADTDELDCAVLLAARTGFLDGTDPRLASTVEAIRAELGAGGPLLYRYSGMSKQEGAFLACSAWLVEALVHVGRRDEALALFEELLGHAGDTGLLTEEIDPDTGQLLGNLPQALTHLAVIGAGCRLGQA